jgi:preprotein translocase subunit YajC
MVRPDPPQARGDAAFLGTAMLISTAYAQDGGAGAMGTLTQFLPLILIFAVFYFILIRPQQARQKEMKTMLSALKRGDRVVTAGGIVAVVQRVPPDKDGKPVSEIEVEIAPNVKVTVLRETITNVIRPQAANDSKPVAKAG